MGTHVYHSRQHKTRWTVWHLRSGYHRTFATAEDARAYAMECPDPTSIRPPVYYFA